MQKATLFIVFILLIPASLLTSQDSPISSGVLDLTGWDMNQPVSLEGEWDFYPELLSPGPWSLDAPRSVHLPSEWDEALGSHFGSGTYHLHIILPGKRPLQALWIRENIQALKIYINEEEIYSTGSVSQDGRNAFPGSNGKLAIFHPPGREFDLIIEASNWHHRQSGLNKPILLGSYEVLAGKFNRQASLDIFIMGIAFSFFFLYLSFYVKRPEYKIALWFALLCLSMGIRTGLTNTSQLESILGEGWTIVSKKAEYLTFLSSVLFFISYIETVLNKFKIKWFSWVFMTPLYFYGIIIILTPMTVYSFLLPFFQYYSLIFVLYLLYFLYRAARERSGASYRLFGECLFMIACLIYDVLFYNGYFHRGPVAGYTLFIVIFLEGIFQAGVLSDVLNRLEVLTNKYRKSIEEISHSRLEIEQQNKQLNWLALYDQLTGLPNRYNLTEVLNIGISRAARNKNKIAVLYMDLDNFKDINDTMGHNLGDELLRLISERLRKTIRKSDSLFRMGGDEFTLVYTDLSDKKQIESIRDKLYASLEKPFPLKGEFHKVSLSIGAAFYPDDGENMDILIKNAELAMYQAKDRGRNHFVSYNDNISLNRLSRINLTNKMKRALEVGHYKLYYQAQINGATGRLYGFEALIRWIDPENGIVPPDKFIPIAEESGFIAQIGRWTLQEACRQINEWQGKGYGDFTVSVNISAYQFGLDHFIFDFREILESSGIDPSYLKVELTETLLMANPHLARRKLEQIQEMGVNIALDDFGTGYSSLSYLNIFPVNYLKIDKAFIRDVHKDGFNKKLTTSIISLGRNLDLELIAEGVETEEERRFVVEQGCHIIQGYVYSKPVPPQSAEDFFRAPYQVRD